MSYIPPLPRSVYLLGDGMLFDEIIAHMLTSVTALRVIKRAYVDKSALLSEVNDCCPDVILLTETDRFDSEEMLALFSHLPQSTNMRIISMSMKHNNVHVLDRPAGWKKNRAGSRYTLQGIDDWNELIELFTGKQI